MYIKDFSSSPLSELTKIIMAEMTPQDTESCIDIVVFANTAQTEEATTAVVDNFVPVSLISTGLVHCLQVRYEEHHRGPVQDSQKRRHVLLDYVELHLHRSDVSKSRSETFYVVESIEAVVLRTAAVPRKEESNVLMFGLEPQIEAMTALSLYLFTSILYSHP